MTDPLFYADSAALEDERIVIDGPEGRHAADVRRLRPGEPVTVGDGAGTLAYGVVAEASRGRIVVAVERRVAIAKPDPVFVVAQALAKGGRDEQAVETMTECGVDEVVGWTAARCVARWSDRTSARWQATAHAAAKQSRRAWIPEVTGPASTTEVAARVRAAALAVVLHEDATTPLAQVRVPPAGEVLVVVGPEGGITAGELAELSAAGGHVCRLGGAVLRSSTAGVAALSVLSAQSRWR